MKLHIGIDDTDSTKGGCTTYVAARLVESLSKKTARFVDYPNIIRLNPNIPYKTRGNAAVALRLEIPRQHYNNILDTVLDEVEHNSRIGEANTDPAVVLVKARPTSRIKHVAQKALVDVVSTEEALRTVRDSHATAVAYGSKLGLVGALAAVGQTLEGDHTFELIAYRREENRGAPRRVDEKSVKRMDHATSPHTFNNYDYENKRMLITPHGPDPVLLGIRGENPAIVLKAFRMLKILEPVERWVVFRTNHGTDAHLEYSRGESRVKPNVPVVLRGIVATRPSRIRGGHVFFDLAYGRHSVRCAAFEPTGKFRESVSQLVPGDEVTVSGGVKPHNADLPLTINLEKLSIRQLVDEYDSENPTCPQCGKHLKSAGRGQGFRCSRCPNVFVHAPKRAVRKTRRLQSGLYVPAMKAHRHLTKPILRYGLEKQSWNHSAPSGKWHSPFY